MLARKLEEFKYWWRDGFMPTFGFFISNPHSIPAVSRLICKMGRHDFEGDKVKYNKKGAPVGVELICFYCEHRETSLFGSKL